MYAMGGCQHHAELAGNSPRHCLSLIPYVGWCLGYFASGDVACACDFGIAMWQVVMVVVGGKNGWLDLVIHFHVAAHLVFNKNKTLFMILIFKCSPC